MSCSRSLAKNSTLSYILYYTVQSRTENAGHCPPLKRVTFQSLNRLLHEFYGRKNAQDSRMWLTAYCFLYLFPFECHDNMSLNDVSSTVSSWTMCPLNDASFVIFLPPLYTFIPGCLEVCTCHIYLPNAYCPLFASSSLKCLLPTECHLLFSAMF
jgi:hypothetical protein